jgi:16S rRNA (uracil1498-N3)-methyltransferase
LASFDLDDPRVWSLDTFLVPPGALADRAVTIAGDEGHHAVDVARIRRGDAVRLIDGEGLEAIGRVSGTGPASAEVEVHEVRTHPRGDGVELTVAQALLKGRAFSEVVRRCSELGVGGIIPVVTERTVAKPPPGGESARLDRMRAVARAAVKQSRGVFVPTISPVSTLGGLAEHLSRADLALVAWEEERAGTLGDLLEGSKPRSIALVVGPEGGLTGDEVAVLAGFGAHPVSVGRRILKADWAAAAVCAMISERLGGLLL